MATRTDNLKLSKAETSDAIKSTLTANNQNFDKLDGVITRLKNNQLQGTASGTEIELTDAGELESVIQLSGNSEQDSRSGKNVLKKGSDYVTKTSYGITFTVNDDESVTINGTNDGTGNSALFIWNSSGTPLVIPAGTYKTRRTGNNQVTIVAYAGATNKYATIASGGRDSVTFENDMSCTQIYIQVAKGSTTTFNNFTFYPIMVKDTDSLEPYEPYGLKPSPEFESPIMSVKSKSDNLFDKNTCTDGYATGNNGELYAESSYSASDFIEIEPNTSYSRRYGSWINIYDSTKTNLSQVSGLINSFTTPANAKYLRVSLKTIDKDKLQLNKGTVVLPYQSYGYVPVEVKVEGKNKVLWEIGTIDQNTGVNVESQTRARTEFNLVAGEEYVINIPYARFRNLVILDNTGTLIGNYQNCTFNKSDNYFSFVSTISGKCKFIVSNDDGATNIDINKYNGVVQLEKGSTPTQVVPFVEPKTISIPLGDIQLRSTPDGTRDTFARVDGVWNLVGNNTSTIFDGSDDEGWKLEGTQKFDDTLYLLSNGFIRQPFAIKNSLLYCDRFTQRNIYSVNQEGVMIEGGSSEWNLRIRVNRNRLSSPDASGFKTYLSTNPMEVVWRLSEPTYTPITDQGLISALDELEELILHKGYNYITVTAVNGVKAHLDLTYYKDINIVLNNMSAMIASIGGEMNV